MLHAYSSSYVSESVCLLPSSDATVGSLGYQAYQNILQFYIYNDDLPCTVSFESELGLCHRRWRADAQLASSLNTPQKPLDYTDKDFYPSLLSIMATLPVTSCECEQSISMLKLVKSPLKSTMGQGRLNSLAMLYYHQDMQVTPCRGCSVGVCSSSPTTDDIFKSAQLNQHYFL